MSCDITKLIGHAEGLQHVMITHSHTPKHLCRLDVAAEAPAAHPQSHGGTLHGSGWQFSYHEIILFLSKQRGLAQHELRLSCYYMKINDTIVMHPLYPARS